MPAVISPGFACPSIMDTLNMDTLNSRCFSGGVTVALPFRACWSNHNELQFVRYHSAGYLSTGIGTTNIGHSIYAERIYVERF